MKLKINETTPPLHPRNTGKFAVFNLYTNFDNVMKNTPIKQLIKDFENLLKVYQEAYDSKANNLFLLGIHHGLCFANIRHGGKIDFYITIFRVYGYYSELLDGFELFPYPKNYKQLLPRINFLKSEIIDLKKLLKKGYTHV